MQTILSIVQTGWPMSQGHMLVMWIVQLSTQSYGHTAQQRRSWIQTTLYIWMEEVMGLHRRKHAPPR